MKQIFLLLFILIASCKTMHKATEQLKLSSDSTKVITKDTTDVVKETNLTQITNLKDISIKINYDSVINKPDGTFVKLPIKAIKGSNKLNDIIGSAISASGSAGKIPSSIEIHIGSIGDSITAHSKTDSTNIKSKDSTKSQVNKEVNTKNVSKSGMSTGAYLIIIMITLIAILLVASKFVK